MQSGQRDVAGANLNAVLVHTRLGVDADVVPMVDPCTLVSGISLGRRGTSLLALQRTLSPTYGAIIPVATPLARAQNS